MDQLRGALPQRLGRRLWLSLRRWPDAGGWLFAGAVGTATPAAIAAIGFGTGLYGFGPANLRGMPMRLLVVLIAPAIGEEVFFRGLLLPGPEEDPAPWLAFVAGLGAFVLWHVLEATTFLRAAAAMFLRADFLVCAGLLGLGCGLMRWRIGSVWPGVALHWLMVTVWQTWLGGFTLEG